MTIHITHYDKEFSITIPDDTYDYEVVELIKQMLITLGYSEENLNKYIKIKN